MERPWILCITSALALPCALSGFACRAPERPAAVATPATVVERAEAPAEAPKSGADRVRALYAKREVMIPMRDGVRLHTAIYTPRAAEKPFAILLVRTPYSCRPYGADAYPSSLGPSDAFVGDDYAVVVQDVRGAYMSEGVFVDVRPQIADKRSKTDVDESSDAWDTIDWLVANVDGDNGNVGMWGISYPGFYAAAGMIDAHPALKAVSPQAPIADWWYDDFRHNGALFLPHAYLFLNSFGRPRPESTTDRSRKWDAGTPDGWRYFLELGSLSNVDAQHFRGDVAFWNELIEHATYDEFWRARDLLPHLNRVAPAVLTVGGWYDAEDLYGPIAIHRATEQRNPGVWNAIVMGPWVHGGWSRTDGDSLGQARFGSKTALHYRESIEKPFFDHHLLGAPKPAIAEATMFDTGRNAWREFESWPPKGLRELALRFRARTSIAAAHGVLDVDLPGADARAGTRGSDEFVSDPSRPVPHTASIELGMNRPYMTEDQRFASRRPDVVTYESEPFAGDTTFVGPIRVRLNVASSATDSDWIVKLVDVHPADEKDPVDPPLDAGRKMGGYERLVRGEVMPARFREGRERAVPTVPGEPTTIEFELLDVLHTFRAGHRAQVQVQCTWFPLVARNPQTFVENPYLADESAYRVATQRVLCDGSELTARVIAQW